MSRLYHGPAYDRNEKKSRPLYSLDEPAKGVPEVAPLLH
jgi:hypothetical protein